MPLVNLQKVLEQAERGNYGVGSFDVFNLETLCGVLEAAEEKKSPVIIAYGEEFDKLAGIENLATIMIRMAQNASVPVVIHLDHAMTYEYVLRAVNSGFSSVMIDASIKPLQENIDITQRVVQVCRTFNVSVEAELGHVSGLEGLYERDDYIYTDVNEAARFARETGIDALAVAIGTVHGVYKEKPRLNLQRLKEIKQAVKPYLVLHGGSGLSEDDFKHTIQNGISKVNIFTDLLVAAMDRIRRDADDRTISYTKQSVRIADAVKRETIRKMEIFGSCGKA